MNNLITKGTIISLAGTAITFVAAIMLRQEAKANMQQEVAAQVAALTGPTEPPAGEQ